MYTEIQVLYVSADDTSLVVSDDLLRHNQSQQSCFVVYWLGRNRLTIMRTVCHLAIGNDRWQQNLLQLRLDVVYLDIYLFYIYGVNSGSDTKHSLRSN